MILGFTFTTSWGALLTAVVAFFGPLTGVVLTQRSNRKAERDRAKAAAAERASDRDHEREQAEAQIGADRQARLYADRRAAYAAFRRAFLDFLRVNARASDAWVAFLNAESEQASAAWEECRVAAKAAEEARRAAEEALVDIEVVASAAVYSAADEVRTRAAELGKLQARSTMATTRIPDDSLERYAEVQEAERTLSDAEQRLRAAIRTELKLDG